MDTESVRLFVLAAEKLNISAAGRSLGMAPAVASAKLAKLEHSLGADLLHRSTRKVSLSVEGEAFLPHAREIISQEDTALAALGQGSANVSGLLRFTASSTFAQLYIAPILPEFLALYPDVHLDLRLSETQFDLIEGSFDLALRNSALEDTSLKGRKLADDTRILCASPGYLSANGAPSHPDDLKRHQLMSFRGQTAKPLIGPESGYVFDTRSASARLSIDDGLSLKLTTMAGAGVAIHSIWSVHRELASGSLVRILPDYVVGDQSVLWLVYPKSNVLSAKVRVFIDFLIDRIGKSPVWEKSVG